MYSNTDYMKWLLLVMKASKSSFWQAHRSQIDTFLDPAFRAETLKRGRLRVPIQLPTDGLHRVSETLTLKPFRHVIDVLNSIEDHFTYGQHKMRVLGIVSWTQLNWLISNATQQWAERPCYGIWDGNQLIAIKWQTARPGTWEGSWNHENYGTPHPKARAINAQFRRLLAQHPATKRFNRKHAALKEGYQWLKDNHLLVGYSQVVCHETLEPVDFISAWVLDHPNVFDIDNRLATVSEHVGTWQADPDSLNLHQFANA